MSRDGSTKVTKYSFQKALLAGKSLTRIAADLGISVRTAQRYLTRFGINVSRQNGNKGVCNSMIIAPEPAPRRQTHLEQVANDHKPFTEDELRELEALGWTNRHECSGESCPMCRKVLKIARAQMEPSPQTPVEADKRPKCRECGVSFDEGRRQVHAANCPKAIRDGLPRFRSGGASVAC